MVMLCHGTAVKTGRSLTGIFCLVLIRLCEKTLWDLNIHKNHSRGETHSLAPLMFPWKAPTTLYMMRGDKRSLFCRWRQETALEARECEINKNLAYSNSFRGLFGCVFSCFVPLVLTVFSNFLLSGSQRGKNHSFPLLLCNEKIAQIVVILEHTVLSMPLLFKYILHTEDIGLILLVSETSLGKGGFHFLTARCALILKSLQLLQRKPLTFSPTCSVFFFPQSCCQTG